MLLSVATVILVAGLPVDSHAGENALTSMRLDVRQDNALFEWRDAEDVVRGTLTPWPVRDGAPFTVSLVVGTVQGEDFSGPVTIALRPLAALGGADAVTIARAAGEKSWVHAFTPDEVGDHRLEVSFRTTRLKVVRGVVPVAPGALPRWAAAAMGGGLILSAAAVGVWLTIRRREGTAAP